jgi:hypothetical protein
MKEIPLSGKNGHGRVALIDDADFQLISAYRWRLWEELLRPEGRPHGPYAIAGMPVNGRRTHVPMHRLITGWPMTDHIDHDGLNNQRSNLRPTDTAQNNHNQRPRAGASSRFKGVTWHKRVGKWQATIKLNGRCIYLGLFISEDEAGAAYDVAALKAYGEYAYLNGGAA